MPLQGSIDANGNKILWGSSQTYPETRGCVWAWGSKALSPALHNIASTTSQISSMRVNDLDSKLMLCDSTDIYQKGTTYDSIWRSEILSFGKPFEVSEVIIPLSRKLVADEVIKVKFLYDNETHESDEYEITLDDYPEMFIKLYPPQQGVSNMIIEITIECGVSILFPIQIEYDFRE